MELIIYSIISFIVFLLLSYITKYIFGLDKILKHSKAQTTLIAAMAEKNGVDRDYIVKVINKAEDFLKTKSHIIELPSD